MLASETAAKASLISKKSTSEIFIFICINNFSTAGVGASVNCTGANSASAKPRILANGLSPRRRTVVPLIKTTALAPSLRGEALPAVIEPPSLNTGRKVGTRDSSNRLCWSSSVISFVVLRSSMGTGTISLANLPSY